MKTMKFAVRSLFAVFLMLAFTSCGQDGSNESDSGSKVANGTSENGGSENADLSFGEESVTMIVNAYMPLKDALVETDGQKAQNAAKELLSVLEKSQGELVGKLKFDAGTIAGTADTEIQRESFEYLSDNLYALVESSDKTSGMLYRQYCPMAKNNQGAYWLSTSSEIMNPYFGDQMLHCGKVTEEI